MQLLRAVPCTGTAGCREGTLIKKKREFLRPVSTWLLLYLPAKKCDDQVWSIGQEWLQLCVHTSSTCTP